MVLQMIDASREITSKIVEISLKLISKKNVIYIITKKKNILIMAKHIRDENRINMLNDLNIKNDLYTITQKLISTLNCDQLRKILGNKKLSINKKIGDLA